MDVVRSLVEEKPVVIFSKSQCCVSHSVTQLISSYGVNPKVYELDEISNGRDIERVILSMGHKPSVPAVFIGQKFVGGANDIISLQIQGKLVPMMMEAGAMWVWNKTSSDKYSINVRWFKVIVY